MTLFFVVLPRDLDFINILSYDYHVASEPQVNHHAPLRARSNFEDEFDPNEELNIVRECLATHALTHLLYMKFRLVFFNTGRHRSNLFA